jgi:hypothetical protein
MDEKELKAFVPENQHADFDELVVSMKTHKDPLEGITNEGFVELLKGNTDLSKIIDERTSASINTWQKNNLDKIYAERYAKEHPEETEEQKRIKALEIKAAENEQHAKRADMRTSTLKVMQDKGLPTDVMDFFIGENEEKTLANLALLEAAFDADRKKTRTDVLKENGRTIPKTVDGADKFYTVAQMQAMSPEERYKNWEKIQESMSYWQSVG